MADSEITYHSLPSSHPLTGELKLPGDKSISHRALLLSALAEGDSTIKNLLMGEDNLATLNALQNLGIQIVIGSNQKILVKGNGLRGLKPSANPLDLGNSGTGLRLLAGILAGQTFSSQLTGDSSLQKRPMKRIVEPLSQMGAKISMSKEGTPPLFIEGGHPLCGINYQMPLASAQVKSCLLLAGLYAKNTTNVYEPTVSRDHTERMLIQFQYPIQVRGTQVTISSGYHLKPANIEIPSDISSAAFFMVAATIKKGSFLKLKNIGINPTRIGVIKILQKMGANIVLENYQETLPEPTADIVVKSSQLKGIIIPSDYIVSAIDEFPAIFIAAAFAKGTTTLRGAAELRVKESDRISAMAEGLNRLNIKSEIYEDGIAIEGGTLTGGIVDSFHDHRVAMSFAIAGCAAQDKISILNCANVATSFPNFIELAKEVGINLEVDL